MAMTSPEGAPKLEVVEGGADPKKKQKKRREKKPRSKKRRWIWILLVLLLLAVLGVLAWCVYSGIIKTPWYKASTKTTKIVKTSAPPKAKPQPAPAAVVPPPQNMAPKAPDPVIPKPTTRIDPEAGARALARVWERVPPEKVKNILKSYKDAEAALVMAKMETKKAAAVLAILDPARAAKVSREISRLASVVPIEEEGP